MSTILAATDDKASTEVRRAFALDAQLIELEARFLARYVPNAPVLTAQHDEALATGDLRDAVVYRRAAEIARGPLHGPSVTPSA